jgi:hypothetical protein
MANYRAVIRHFPPALDYLRHATKWVRRGDVLGYPPLIKTPSFSTDAFGFRHTFFEGNEIGIGQIESYSRIGLLLGSSHVFGFGLTNNRETLASQLSELLEYPFFGIVFPEADTRTLHATLTRILNQHGRKIHRIILATGGDFTRYCYTEKADPLFGPPMLPYDATLYSPADEAWQFANLLAFTQFWCERSEEVAGRFDVPLALADDTTFFEKTNSDPQEQACQLGTAQVPNQRRRFEAHHRRISGFLAQRREFAAAKGIQLAGFPDADALVFFDEYHYRPESQRLIAETLANQLA